MISPAQVPPFDDTEIAWLAKTEGDIDKALAADKKFTGEESNVEWRCWVEIARRYQTAGWHVVVLASGGARKVSITHPSWILDDGIETQEYRIR